MIKCVLLSMEDYESIMTWLNDAIVDVSKLPMSMLQISIDMKLDNIKNVLIGESVKKEGEDNE